MESDINLWAAVDGTTDNVYGLVKAETAEEAGEIARETGTHGGGTHGSHAYLPVTKKAVKSLTKSSMDDRLSPFGDKKTTYKVVKKFLKSSRRALGTDDIGVLVFPGLVDYALWAESKIYSESKFHFTDKRFKKLAGLLKEQEEDYDWLRDRLTNLGGPEQEEEEDEQSEREDWDSAFDPKSDERTEEHGFDLDDVSFDHDKPLPRWMQESKPSDSLKEGFQNLGIASPGVMGNPFGARPQTHDAVKEPRKLSEQGDNQFWYPKLKDWVLEELKKLEANILTEDIKYPGGGDVIRMKAILRRLKEANKKY